MAFLLLYPSFNINLIEQVKTFISEYTEPQAKSAHVRLMNIVKLIDGISGLVRRVLPDCGLFDVSPRISMR